MDETKQKILDKALELFNEQGVADVSIRQLAQQVNISHSNLIYHFPTKLEIVLGLHEMLLARALKINQEFEVEDFSFGQLHDTTKIGFSAVYDFRFLFNDMLYICNTFPEMKKTMIAVERVRSDMYKKVINLSIEKQLMRQEAYENEYDHLIMLIKIYSDHWLVSASIYDELMKNEIIDKYAKLFMSYFYPYLTPKGKSDYRIKQIIGPNLH